jgi:hypothetical protein
MATKFYLPEISENILPDAPFGGWTVTGAANRVLLGSYVDGLPNTGLKSIASSGMSGIRVLNRQYQAGLFLPQTVSGKVSGVVACLAYNCLLGFELAIRFVNEDGSGLGNVVNFGGNANFPTGSSVKAVTFSHNLSPLTLNENAYMLVEIGYKQQSGGYCYGSQLFGYEPTLYDQQFIANDNASGNPWIQFSQNFQMD